VVSSAVYAIHLSFLCSARAQSMIPHSKPCSSLNPGRHVDGHVRNLVHPWNHDHSPYRDRIRMAHLVQHPKTPAISPSLVHHLSPLIDAAVLDSPELRPFGGCSMSDAETFGSCGTGSFRWLPSTMSEMEGPVCCTDWT